MAVGMATDGVFCRAATGAAVAISTDGVICSTAAILAGAWQEIKKITLTVNRLLSFKLGV